MWEGPGSWGWLLAAGSFSLPVVAHGLAGALLPLVPALAALGLLVRRTGLAPSHAQRIGGDVSAIVQTLDRISHGAFDAGCGAVTPEGETIGAAVQSMARKIGTQIEGLQEAAQRDPLTGMANRAHFQRVVERWLDQRGERELCCLLFLDVDGFKAVNDTLGHNLGDRLLQCIADRLKMATCMDEFLEPAEFAGGAVKMARFGGDEFVIFIAGLRDDAPARKVANRVLRVIGEPFELSAHVAGVSASIGMAFVPGDASSYSELLRAADTAMYQAKRSGRNRAERFTHELYADLHRKVALERDLHEALAKGQFELHYQPLFDCRTLDISSVEALIRWRHPQRGFINPAEFIPLAEKSNLICDIGEWVVHEAARAIHRFETRGRPLRIAVNVSPHQLDHMDFVSLVKSSLQRSQVTPTLLEIEITESLAMRDSAMAADRLRRLAEMGVSIAVDDFGTGYSNLASLIRLPISRLKIDRSLLDDFTVRPEARILVQTIISMANSLGFHSVAEGVEDADQLTLLCDMGCDVVQGYHLSRPVDEATLAAFVFDRDSPPGSAARRARAAG